MNRRTGLEEGQTIPTVALMMLFILAIVTVVADTGFVWMQRRNLQNSADAAALAAAQQLPSTDADAEAKAVEYANKNVPALKSTTVTFRSGCRRQTIVRPPLRWWFTRTRLVSSESLGSAPKTFQQRQRRASRASTSSSALCPWGCKTRSTTPGRPTTHPIRSRIPRHWLRSSWPFRVAQEVVTRASWTSGRAILPAQSRPGGMWAGTDH